MVITYGQLCMKARKALLRTEDEHMASMLARNLVCHYSGKTPAEYLASRDLFTSEKVVEQVEEAVARLQFGEPLPYVIGQWEFYGLTLTVTPAVLIPRDDTCAVTELAIHQGMFLGKNPRILDLCTGSGCIGIAVATKLPDARVTLADISQEALAVAKKNVTSHKLTARVSCVQADALGDPPSYLGKFDMIISNPPYVTGKEMEELPVSVKNYEPHLALYGGPDGLDFYRNIVKEYSRQLKPGGLMCFEFGMGQGDAVCDLLTENGYRILERKRDYNDRERAVIARLTRKED